MLGWDPEQDLCNEKPDDKDSYSLEKVVYDYPPKGLKAKRKLPPNMAEQAMAYIRVCVKKYPFQLRYTMGLPMWLRFCDVWNDTGDFRKAMRAI